MSDLQHFKRGAQVETCERYTRVTLMHTVSRAKNDPPVALALGRLFSLTSNPFSAALHCSPRRLAEVTEALSRIKLAAPQPTSLKKYET